MDLIPKHGILIKVQFRDFSWNLAPPTPAGPPRGSSVGVYLSSYYKTENDGILRIDLYCQKLQNSLNLMIILKNWMSHWEYLKSAVKDGRFLDRGSLAGVWSNHVWRDFPEIVILCSETVLQSCHMQSYFCTQVELVVCKCQVVQLIIWVTTCFVVHYLALLQFCNPYEINTNTWVLTAMYKFVV